jgi:hypothetical protein
VAAELAEALDQGWIAVEARLAAGAAEQRPRVVLRAAAACALKTAVAAAARAAWAAAAAAASNAPLGASCQLGNLRALVAAVLESDGGGGQRQGVQMAGLDNEEEEVEVVPESNAWANRPLMSTGHLWICCAATTVWAKPKAKDASPAALPRKLSQPVMKEMAGAQSAGASWPAQW